MEANYFKAQIKNIIDKLSQSVITIDEAYSFIERMIDETTFNNDVLTDLNKKTIDNVTVENLDIALKMADICLDKDDIDKIIEIVEILEEKGNNFTINDIILNELNKYKIQTQTDEK